MKFAVLLMGLCCFHQASGEIHSHTFILTRASGIQEFPEFMAEAFVDGQQISVYNSTKQKLTPKEEWVKGAVDPDFWNRNTKILLNQQEVFRNHLEVARERFNHTPGVHTWQMMYGCEFDDETAATNAFRSFGYDGEDFIITDLKNYAYIAPVPQAVPTKIKWENDKGQLEYLKTYYTHTCIDWLKKYVQYGSNILGKNVSPVVSVFKNSSPGVVCHATGFYPEGVMITWKRDGQELQEDVNVGETLPNEDGTFQKRAVLTVSPEEWSKYTCEVAHKSGSTVKTVDELQPGASVPIGLIVGVAICVFLLIGCIVGVLWWKQRNSGFVRANTKDDGSTSSDETQRKV